MSTAQRAVFLSYASQDAEAARRICDALRASGIVVWFDQSELRGGDAWDQKIRKQIKECALFVPIISANTQARTEGYFRLEWKLADRRTDLIGKSKAFLLPVCIDDTRDAEADVPDSFVAVQWTRLPAGEVPSAFCERVKVLLTGNVGAGPPMPVFEADRERAHAAPTKINRQMWRLPVVAVLAVIGGLAFWRPWREGGTAVPPSAGPAVSAAHAPPESEAAQLARRAIALATKLSFTREDLAVAADLASKASELRPELALAWGARARVEVAWLHRNWDVSAKRRQSANEFARRALALDANEPNALWAQGMVLRSQGALVDAEALFQQALAVAPDDNYIRRALAGSLSIRGREAEAQSVYEECIRRNPRDVLAYYSLSLQFARGSGLRDNDPHSADIALRHLDAALAVQPIANVITQKATVQAVWGGDLTAARATLDRLNELPLAERSDDRTIYTAMWLALLERQPDRVLAAPALSTLTYFNDAVVAEPIAWMKALAHRIAERENAARQEWQAAETLVRQRLQSNPNSLNAQAELAVTLAWLGERDEAARVFARYEAVARERGQSLFYSARYHAGLADGAAVARALAATRSKSPTVWCSDPMLRLDPWWDKVRETPEFQALLPATKTVGAAVPTDSKSVAVLAFTNLSDDRENEYFSDGVSEELLNVLAKVPGLRVAARTSAFYFKGRNATAQQIGQMLGVAHLVEGSVRREGANVRVVARLSRTDTGEQLWSDKFDGELKNIFALQDEIAGRIAENLKLKLGGARRVSPVNPEAHRLYLEGRHFWNQRTEDAFARAERAFAQAVQLDPSFARAHAGLADLWATRAWYYTEGGRTGAASLLAQAESAAQKALELDPGMAEVHATFGAVHLVSGRIAEAEQAIQRCVMAAPNYATARNWHGEVMLVKGRLDLALEDFLAAARLDPLSPIVLVDCARELRNAHRPAEALAYAERCLALSPESRLAAVHRAGALLELGRRDEALAAGRLLAASEWSADLASVLSTRAVHLLRQCGHEVEAVRLADTVAERLDAGSFFRGFLLASLGRHDDALPFLAKSPRVALARTFWDPAFDSIRDDARFLKVVADLGCAAEYKVARDMLPRMLKEQAAKK